MSIDQKTDLLRKLRETHTAMRDLLPGVDLEQTISPGSDWRIRDILGHIATWDQILANALQAYLEDSQFVVIQDWDQEEVEFNQRAVLQQSTLSEAALLDRWEQAHEAFANALETLPPGKLQGDYVYPWADERGDIFTLVEIMIEHNSEHREEIARAVEES